uniref:Uncharacterized protein n=1 Tax=Cajanus cajan TaxID=3821 RepID=A0A151TQ54_CAJCA|nr:hypothetical protein KK1_008401 [Cajanus cajan]
MTQGFVSKRIQCDLMLLENQIPMIVLEKLYDKVVPSSVKKHNRFIELARNYFIYSFCKFKNYILNPLSALCYHKQMAPQGIHVCLRQMKCRRMHLPPCLLPSQQQTDRDRTCQGP